MNPVSRRFASAGRKPWEDVPDSDWHDWHWQQRNQICSVEQLQKVIPLSSEELEACARGKEMFEIGITPYYASLMDPSNRNDPVRLQAVPQPGELTILDTDLEDPLAEERDMPVPGLTHRYPDRVLFYVSYSCPAYCRHCTRKRKVANPSSATLDRQLEQGFAYIENHPEVRDIVVSGGDPLNLSDSKLDYILSRLRAIPHVEIIRLGSRNPVTRPMRITDQLVGIIKKYHPVYLNTHFNHPNECTLETFHACTKLADAGIPVGNQMVLLKGINDDPGVVKKLNHLLLLMRVKPYYIFQCDMARGISHYRTPIEVGIDIIENLRGHTSGMAVPHLVIDTPGGGGKIPITPNYVVSRDGKKLVLRNFEKKRFDYYEP